jgi:hypothetical protein
MIFAAPPPRANKGSLDPATAIAIAASSNFREFFMSSSLGLKAGCSPEVNPLFFTAVCYRPLAFIKAVFFAAVAPDRWRHAVNAVLGAGK